MSGHAPPPPAPRFLLSGDRALVVEFGETIDATLNARVHALAARISACRPRNPGILGVVPTYRSLTILYEPLRIPLATLRAQVLDCLKDDSVAAAAPEIRRWVVPVCYGGEFGEDLDAVALAHGMTPAEAIAVHSRPIYRIYMVGFLPGFAYLGGLDPRLHTPRRASPRPHTPAGSINIGGQQTAVASVAGPSGWHLLGRTPWRSFDPRRDAPCLFAPGDEVVFRPIDAAEYACIAEQAARPDFTPQAETGRTA